MPIDFPSWQPRTWNEIVGNYRIKRYFQNLARKVRGQIATNGDRVSRHFCFLLTGESRSGKTASVKFLVRCIVCQRLDTETMSPCEGSCEACQSIFANSPEGEWGIFSILRAAENQTPVHFFLINCAKIYTPADLIRKLNEIRQCNGQGYVIVYLDEVHRLVPKHMDEILLKEVEESRYLWFFSTANPEPLEPMFRNRLLQLRTEVPTDQEMESLLVGLCDEAVINWEPEAMSRAIEKSNRLVGLALQALQLASLAPEGLTLDLVENDWQVSLDD